MDEETALILAIQVIALSCIAGALFVYLICKVNRRKHTYDTSSLNVGTGRSVLITSCETTFGIQLALHLTSLGFRVFAGIKPPNNDNTKNDAPQCFSEIEKLLKAKLKHREAISNSLIGMDEEEYPARTCNFGNLIIIPLDVTREDSLHDALDYVRRHLPAGEDGLWAVINTAGICCKGRLDQQESSQWETMFKVNVFGLLRTVRTFMPLLKNKKGRLLTFGIDNECKTGSSGNVVHSAARHAVVGASSALAYEMSNSGIDIITINTQYIATEKLFLSPRLLRNESQNSSHDRYMKYEVTAVPDYAMDVIEEALLVTNPKTQYEMSKPTGFNNYLSIITDKINNIQKTKYSLQSTTA